MNRKTFFIISAACLAGTGIFGGVGTAMSADADFAREYVRQQLSQQHITFKASDALTPAEKESACLREFAGQLMVTGKQAECYANDFIGLHVKEVALGKTYADLGLPELALREKVKVAQQSGDPRLPELQKELAALSAQRDTLFEGETSRGLLLTAYGFSVLGAKAGTLATVMYSAAAVLAIAALAALAMGVRQAAPAAARARRVTVSRDGALAA